MLMKAKKPENTDQLAVCLQLLFYATENIWINMAQYYKCSMYNTMTLVTCLRTYN